MSAIEFKTDRTDEHRLVTLDCDDPETGALRVEDLYQCRVIAWRYPRIFVGPVHHRQIIG